MILIMGVPGSGKSLQGKLLADAKAYRWISTGELLRKLVTGDRRKDMDAGKLLGDEEVIALVDKLFSSMDVNAEFILDGFPRTKKQADWLLTQGETGGLKVTHVLFLNASEAVVVERLLKRGRQDDAEDVIKHRFWEYRTRTLPILEEFKNRGVLVHEINSDKTPEAIHQGILRALQSKN